MQVGSLPKGDIDVGTGLVGAPAYVTYHGHLISGNKLTKQKKTLLLLAVCSTGTDAATL